MRKAIRQDLGFVVPPVVVDHPARVRRVAFPVATDGRRNLSPSPSPARGGGLTGRAVRRLRRWIGAGSWFLLGVVTAVVGLLVTVVLFPGLARDVSAYFGG